MKVSGVMNKQRFLALSIDGSIAIILVFMIGIPLREQPGAVKAIAMVCVYLGYFIISEGFWSRTIGKYHQGLIVRTLGGEKIGWSQALIRGLMIVFELNPLLFGGLPAGLAVLSSDRKQRIGDMLAGTVVVPENLTWTASDLERPESQEPIVDEGPG
jgi:uncharacterized RDD family membrane protein YckC